VANKYLIWTKPLLEVQEEFQKHSINEIALIISQNMESERAEAYKQIEQLKTHNAALQHYIKIKCPSATGPNGYFEDGLGE
jgi:hypothetical protein